MSDSTIHPSTLTQEHQEMGNKCFHPTGALVQFPVEDFEASVPERFEKIVRMYPDRLAVKTGERSLTYDELNRLANRIARAILQKLGPGSEPVVLLIEHGVDLIAAIFAVLKTDKCFVVLDSSLPIERMNLIIADSQARLIATNTCNWSRAKKCPNAADMMLNVDEIDPGSASENLDIKIDPTTISSIVYTSGSTGTPKGVIDCHRNILQSSRHRGEALKVNVEDRLSLLHSLAYISGRINLYLALFRGASVFPFDLRAEGVNHLSNWLARERITILHCPVALFRQFAELHAESIPLPDLRVLHVSGAPLTRGDFELYKKHFHDGVSLEISMGTTEARGIGFAVLDKQYTFPAEGTPVGFALPHKTILILDSSQKALPNGEVGEIAVQGRNLSPGYWRNPELTQARYIDDPNGGDERIYLTGDLGILLPDGFLIHLGRKDLMIKIRGYRVNISEVENALLEHPAVKEAGIAVWEREPGETYLAAYVVANRDSAPTVSDLREFLSNKLPDYMLPSAVMFLDLLPLTNGKLDRSALPKPSNARPELNTSYIAPKTPIEETLAKIWAEVLSVDRSGLNDDFFDLGGHSLAGAALLTRVKETFGAELAVTDLLERPTVALMAEVIDGYLGHRMMPERHQDASEVTMPPTGSIRETPNSFSTFHGEEVEQSIPERFEKIVRMFPDRLAVKMGERSLTYDELNQYANRIGREILKSRGPGNEPIALLFDHGIDVIAALLGVLKAGKFYVALDPAFPRERLEYMLRDSETALLLVNHQSSSHAKQFANSSRDLLNVNEIDESVSSENLGMAILPTDLVNIRYTSGSTGVPKGVTRNHQSSSQVPGLMQVSPEDRFSLVHSLSFGSAAMDLYVSLLNGAALLLFDLKSRGVEQLASWLSDEQMTVCHFPPDLFRQLAEEISPQQDLSHLRLIRLSGASISRREFELYRNRFPSMTLLEIGMGSTETGHICSAKLDKTFSFPDEGTPVGYPVKGIEILLLGEDRRQVSSGEIGEIAVSGPSLAFGYWKEPGLTDAKFLPDPTGANRKIYLTGDLGQMLPDGFLIHRGRKDLTVKIRGYRVNVAEVEAAFLEHARIKEAGVAAWDRGTGEKYLAGYVVPREEAALDVSELYKFLRIRLPDYMIPSTIIFLESLPLTNGKLNRHALPEPDNRRPDLKAPYVLPSTEVEKRLSRIWSEVLRIEQVGVDDNFFDLGGHSLSGTRLISLIQGEFGFHLPVSEFFSQPTIAQLAQRIEANEKVSSGMGKKAWTYVCELQRGTNRKPVFMFPGGGGGEPEFFVYGFLARHVGPEYPFYGLRARGADGTLKPHTSVEQMADAYVEEIRAIQPEGPYFLVGECAGGVTAYEAARQLVAQGQEVAMLVLMDVERPTLSKYLAFRVNHSLDPIRQNYYVTRIPYHLSELRLLPLSRYPRYFFSRLGSTLGSIHRRNSVLNSQERADAVLRAGASGRKLRHIEWVRENYRRTVRRFRPRPYDGRFELLVSEKLYRCDPTLGWKKPAIKGISVHALPGNHETYIREYVTVAGLKLRECLERAEGRQKSCGT